MNHCRIRLIFSSDFYTEKHFYQRDKFFIRPGEKNARLFRAKIPKSFNNCTLRIGGSPWPPFIIQWGGPEPGIECEFLNDIAKIINASIHVVHSSDGLVGRREINGSWSEKDRFLQLKQIDILIGGLYTSPERIEDFETSHWYMQNSLAWHVPAARPISKSKILWLLVSVS